MNREDIENLGFIWEFSIFSEAQGNKYLVGDKFNFKIDDDLTCELFINYFHINLLYGHFFLQNYR